MTETPIFQDTSFAYTQNTISYLSENGYHEDALELALELLASCIVPPGPSTELYEIRQKAERLRGQAAALGPVDPTEEG